MDQTIFNIIMFIVVLNFALERWLAFLNAKSLTDQLPKELSDVYDPEEYKRSQQYKKANEKFSLITGLYGFALIVGMLLWDGFAFVDSIARSFSSNEIVVALIFFGIIMFVSDILNLPFSWYGTFVIEEKFGFNKTTVKTFILDKIKGWLLGGLVGGGLLALIVFIYLKTGENFWIYTWLVVSGFSVFIAMFYSSLIVPLFNKQTPLEDGELRTAIQSFSNKAGFKLNNIFIMDGSKRSTKANAYFSGFGPKKRIVLFDTLVEELSTQEIVAVLAHEIGHYKLKHTMSTIALSIIQTGVTFFILSLLLGSPDLSKALGSDIPSFHLGLVAFGMLYTPISTVVGLFMNVFSRRNEYQADHYAASFSLGEELISALKKLSVKSLSNLTPHAAYVFFNYSHPTLLQRMQAIRIRN